MWDELINCGQILVCNSGGCKHEIGPKLDQKREEEQVHQFLMDLDESLYGMVWLSLLATEPFSMLNKVYSTFVKEERIETLACGKDEY